MHPPSVDRLARTLESTGIPHPLLVDAARSAISAGDPGSARHRAEAVARTFLRPVINATGVLLHTNLGRAPLGHRFAGQGRYSNLEFDLDAGARGSRHAHAAALVARACGADDALVVNNGAAAILLVLTALAGPGVGVAVSRGELVEIGGGFRIPDVLAQSGARLIEVGTTNRTRLSDYERATAADAERVADMVLKVHPSNYRITGFTSSVAVSELTTLGVPIVVDAGSGLLDASTPWLGSGPPPAWLAGEPAVRQTLDAGATVVTFSGDKLLGGPQAGIIAGSAEAVERCRSHPLARALRPGGLVLEALQAVALAYLDRDGMAIPFWRMATAAADELRARAEALDAGTVVACESVPGGGSTPGLTIPSAGVAVAGDVSGRLRSLDPPILGRVAAGRTVLDLRTVDPSDDAVVGAALRSL